MKFRIITLLSCLLLLLGVGNQTWAQGFNPGLPPEPGAYTPKFQLTVSAEDESQGSVSGSGQYEVGVSVTIRAIANSDYTFSYWTKDDSKEVYSTSATFSYKMTAASAKFIAHFEYCPPTTDDPETPVVGDLNGDGRISVVDAVQMINIEQGLRPIDQDAATRTQRIVINVGISSVKEAEDKVSWWVDRTRVVFTPDATPEYDLGKDGAKFWSDDKEVPQLCSMDNNSKSIYSIQEVPHTTCVLPAAIRIASGEDYVIGLIGDAAITIYIIDKTLHQCHNLNESPYIFSSLPGTYYNRFAFATEPFILADIDCDAAITSKDVEELVKKILN